ncbi:MAG: MMPL family transporter [Acidobacteriota bacterium]
MAAVLALMIVSAEGVRRVAFDADVLSLLPRGGRIMPAFRQFLAAFGNVDQLYVVFTAPEGHPVSDYSEEVDEWVDRLRQAPEIGRVDAGVVDRTRDFGWLAERQLLLLGGATLDRALDRLRPAGVTAAVASRRELLTVPSPDVAALVRQDPIGLTELISDALGGTDAGINLGVGTQGYLTKDGQGRLIMAQPRRPPYDAAFSRALDARLRAIETAVRSGEAERAGSDDGAGDERRPPLRVEFAGGHRIALETEAVVKRESILNTVGSLALILPLLYFAFRSLWLVVVGSLPSAVSLLVVLGALGFTGATLSAAAAGSAAMLFGLGVDGVVLLYVSYRLAGTQGADPEGAIGAIGAPSVSMLLGMWTTAATFYGLTFVDFPSLQQLGLLIGHSMVICGILTLVLVPALLPRRVPKKPVPLLIMNGLAAWIASRRRTILGAAALVTCLLGLAATRLQINPTLERLRSVTPAALIEERIAPAFGLPSDVYVVVATGTDLEPLLETNERLTARLAKELPGIRMQPPTRLLPSGAAQARTAARIDGAQLSPPAVRASLEQAAASAGFRPGSFDPFVERLPRLLDATQRLTYDGFVSHGLGDLVGHFIARSGGAWLLATYVFPSDNAQVDALQAVVDAVDPAQTLTGLPLVNRELARQFLPQLLKGLLIGTVIVMVLVGAAFRGWRLSAFALTPTALGLIWAAGLLALAGVELDLFAIFAIVTFVGIGVDYGIHLVHRYQEKGDAGRTVAELAPVILVAAGITMLGYGTLLNSTYPPLRSIGVVSAVTTVTLAVASVFVLPALLMGRRE